MGASASILAGGTDLIVNLKHRLSSPAAVISLRNITEMKGIEVKPDSIVIRAGTSLMETGRNQGISEHFPVLVKAIESIGALGIQHFRGTIGGNLCLTPRCLFYNQSFFWRTGKGSCHRTGGKECFALQGAESCQSICSADTIPVLMALSAQLTIAGAGGTRTVPVAEFFTGKGESPFNLTPEEIVSEIRLPLPWAPISAAYRRLSLRSAVDFPLMNAAAVAVIEKGTVETFRLVLSAAGPAPVIIKEAETLIKGNPPALEMVQEAGEMALRAAEGVVVENACASKDYRIKMAGTMVRRAVKEALGL